MPYSITLVGQKNRAYHRGLVWYVLEEEDNQETLITVTTLITLITHRLGQFGVVLGELCSSFDLVIRVIGVSWAY